MRGGGSPSRIVWPTLARQKALGKIVAIRRLCCSSPGDCLMEKITRSVYCVIEVCRFTASLNNFTLFLAISKVETTLDNLFRLSNYSVRTVEISQIRTTFVYGEVDILFRLRTYESTRNPCSPVYLFYKLAISNIISSWRARASWRSVSCSLRSGVYFLF